jgi:hypothetical protein
MDVKKRLVLYTLLIGLGMAACQINSLLPESTPFILPTRLVLPSPTVSTYHPLPSSSQQPSTAPQPGFEPTSVQHGLATATLSPSLVFPTIQPSPSATHMGRFSGNAKGIELNESTGKVDPTKLQADFGVVYGGAGWEDITPNYKANILALDQANIPCLFLWDILLPAGFDASRPGKSFPPENEEPNVAAITKSAKGKAIAGIIIRFLDKDTSEHKVFTQGWMANYITWMVAAVYHQTGKPLYVMTSQEFIKSFGDAPDLNQVISTIDGMSSWKSATPGQKPQLASWNAFPIPGDNYVPEYISDNESLYFYNYARTAWKFDGIDASSTPLWMYKSSAAQLKKDLGYKDHDIFQSANPTPTAEG